MRKYSLSLHLFFVFRWGRYSHPAYAAVYYYTWTDHIFTPKGPPTSSRLTVFLSDGRWIFLGWLLIVFYKIFQQFRRFSVICFHIMTQVWKFIFERKAFIFFIIICVGFMTKGARQCIHISDIIVLAKLRFPPQLSFVFLIDKSNKYALFW